jgi:ABC-2 type transport system permease protein
LFWRHIVGRLLLSIFPGSWLDAEKLREGFEETGGMHVGVHGLSPSLTFEAIGDALASPSMLIGIAAGVAMIAAAIYFRRSRVESFA